MTIALAYVSDPMCSWCYAARDVVTAIYDRYPNTEYVLGGLAEDSDAPMPPDMRDYLIQTWQRIENVCPTTKFNFDYWQLNTPRRSTWPACRAVLAAGKLRPDTQVDTMRAMTSAIQHAYYQEAKNPSNDDTLIECAVSIGLDSTQFSQTLHTPANHAAHQAHMHRAAQIGTQGYPSLIAITDTQYTPITIDYNDASLVLERIGEVLGGKSG